MGSTTYVRRIVLAGFTFASLWAGTVTLAADPAGAGVRVQIDNDLFAGTERDRDYTGGLAFTLSGEAARDNWFSLDGLLGVLDRAGVGPQSGTVVGHAQQFGLLAFTPSDIAATAPLPNDRPYANLLFLSNARTQLEDDGRTAWWSSVTLGVLGLPLAEQIHNVIHDAVGSERPRGYDHQISNGGELTARYALARQSLLVANPSATLDVKTTLQGSVGFLTEASAALSVRVGRFSSPWWSFSPELTDYTGAPVPVAVGKSSRPDLYLFAGVRVKARAYNALLQGQWRHSEVRFTSDEIEPLVAVAWIGVVTQVMEQTQLSYTLNYQTAEVRHGDAARDALWGAVQLSHSF